MINNVKRTINKRPISFFGLTMLDAPLMKSIYMDCIKSDIDPLI